MKEILPGALHELADAATPGPWAVDDEGAVWTMGETVPGGTIAYVNYDHQTGDHHPHGDAALIAFMDPETVKQIATVLGGIVALAGEEGTHPIIGGANLRAYLRNYGLLPPAPLPAPEPGAPEPPVEPAERMTTIYRKHGDWSLTIEDNQPIKAGHKSAQRVQYTKRRGDLVVESGRILAVQMYTFLAHWTAMLPPVQDPPELDGFDVSDREHEPKGRKK